MPAVVIGAIIAGGAAVGSAVIQSNAVKNATDTQVAAGQKALDLQQQVFQTQQQNQAPYRAIGLQSLAGLSNLASQPSQTSSTGWNTVKNPNVGPAGAPPVPNYSAFTASPPPPGTAVPRASATLPQGAPFQSTTLANPGGPAASATGFGATPPSAPTAPTGSGTGPGVLMRAPTGATQLVDPSQVAHYQALGATVVQ